MANWLRVTRDDGSSFVGVANGSITQQGGNTSGATLYFPFVGWMLLDGDRVKGQSQVTTVGALGSRVLVQNFASVGTQASVTRYVLIESSNSGYVAYLDGSNEQKFNEGEYIDVINSNPPVISGPATYDAQDLPETASAIADGEEALSEVPEP